MADVDDGRKRKEALLKTIREQEAERRAKAVDGSATVKSATVVRESGAQSGSATPPSRIAPVPELLGPDVCVGDVMAVLPALFVAMVEQRKGLLDALKANGVTSATFFTALDASQNLRDWYRGVKAAQAVMDVELVDEVLTDMDDDAGSEVMGNSIRNAKMQAARMKLEQARWAAQRLLPALFGDKQKADAPRKVEIVVRREARRAKAAQVEE